MIGSMFHVNQGTCVIWYPEEKRCSFEDTDPKAGIYEIGKPRPGLEGEPGIVIAVFEPGHDVSNFLSVIDRLDHASGGLWFNSAMDDLLSDVILGMLKIEGAKENS